MKSRQSGPAYWVEALPDRVAADSTVNWLANQSRTLNLGEVDMRRLQAFLPDTDPYERWLRPRC